MGRHKQRTIEFKKEEHMFLKISSNKGVIGLGVCRKLSLRYTCPFEILERVGDVAYILALPSSLEEVHNNIS